ncbi:hypothetical protein C1645_789029 [Glomus cerebriforme]|uniref:Uncharacterized protein n=1 Tax=Glomus cerebriforme TaxID=658196 RepID=A0A397SH49_9GLOM|nr:hypothetical protein C1645_789029 [Glomus cerebriforme]
MFGKRRKQISSFVLDTLEMIFGMRCLKIDGLPVILLRANEQRFDKDWTQQLVEKFNNLIKNKWCLKNYWLAVSLFVLYWTFGRLRNAYTQDKYDVPLSDDLKQKFEEYLKSLYIILEDICKNLKDENIKIDEFCDNLEAFQNQLKIFTPFVDELNTSLGQPEGQIEKVQKEKNNRLILTGVSIFIFWLHCSCLLCCK